MEKVMRLLRYKYGISARELASHANVSEQRIFQLEILPVRPTPYLHSLLSRAFTSIICEREADLLRLKQDIDRYRNVLLEYADTEGSQLKLKTERTEHESGL